MKKILIAPLGLLTQPKWQDSINAFRALRIGTLSLLWHWPGVNRAINQYKIGVSSGEQFFQDLQTLFPQLSHVRESDFWNAWNQSCGFTAQTQADLDMLHDMQEQGVSIYIICRSNPAHIAYIKQQYVKTLPGALFLSYEQGTIGGDLTKALMQKINLEHPGMLVDDIVHLRAEPRDKPYPNLWNNFGWLRWVLAPFQMLQYSGQQRAYRAIQQQEALFGFSGLDWPTDNTLVATFEKKILVETLTASRQPDSYNKVPDIEDLVGPRGVPCCVQRQSGEPSIELVGVGSGCQDSCTTGVKAKKCQ